MGKKNFITDTNKSHKRNRGFTLVEILLVLFVIGTLAGISIMGYGAWRKNVATDQITSELNGVASAMESARNFGSGYPTSIPSNFKASSDVTLTYKSGTAKTFCIEATTTQDSSLLYRYDISEKKEPQSGSCAVSAPIVANLMRNPNPSDGVYWKASSSAIISLSYIPVSGSSAVRSTRITTSNVALYGERNGIGVVSASTGDQYTIMFTVSSNITTTLSFQVGNGASLVTTSTLSGAGRTINLVAGVPQTIVHTFTVPSGFTNEPLMFKMLWGPGVGAVGDYFDISKVMWVPGVYTGAYADGYNTAAGWAWDGTANASTSTGPAL